MIVVLALCFTGRERFADKLTNDSTEESGPVAVTCHDCGDVVDARESVAAEAD